MFCFFKGLFLLFRLRGKFKFPPKKVFNIDDLISMTSMDYDVFNENHTYVTCFRYQTKSSKNICRKDVSPLPLTLASLLHKQCRRIGEMSFEKLITKWICIILFRPNTYTLVWPDIKKRSPIDTKSFPISDSISVFFKSNVYQNCLKVTKYLGYFCKNICPKKFKISPILVTLYLYNPWRVHVRHPNALNQNIALDTTFPCYGKIIRH